MSDALTRIKLCTICCEQVKPGQPYHRIKTRSGTIYAHVKCYEAEQRERMIARLTEEGKA
jgi:hypothetical protein